MQRLLCRGLSMVALLLLSMSSTQAAPSDAKAAAHRFLSRASMAPVALDFADFLAAQLARDSIDVSGLTELQRQLAALQPGSTCESIELSGLAFDLQLLEQRQQLVATAPPGLSYEGSFSTMPDGRDWYRHWLRSWLLSDVTPEQLTAIARAELSAALALREQQRAPASPHADLPAYRADQHAEIVAGFRQREQVVKAHLEHVFSPAPGFDPVKISPSRLPKSFPAPGIYNGATGEFFYHLQGDTMEGSHMDWLYLHEAVPGHHYQRQLARHERVCPEAEGRLQPMVSTEGWGAYVETLGSALGLLSHPDSAAYVLEWRILRALRVLIDVGIHWQGWSDDQARALWRQYLPGNDFVMEREIARVHRWPVQTITYVYGKHLLEATMDRLRGIGSPAEIRGQLLRMTYLPPAALEYTETLLNRERKDDAG